ncbi:MAG: hypothetical protein E7216_08690 [Clostridium thermopalmarium]|uniref:hypothetical protein n=1 Tax=Clostridium thermopalmarium TaxID=29373 RepID=UPI002357697F|nr:hypothetical protein [Clostridium thermopalmarium]MBE6044293.1 hypothetical protein [Clostridium thermopalmarium]
MKEIRCNLSYGISFFFFANAIIIKIKGGIFVAEKANYPILSVFIDEVYPLSKEQLYGKQDVTADTSLSVSAYSKILPETTGKALDFADSLIKYFTPTLLLHHHQDEVPLFTIYLGVDEEHVDLNTYGGYYSKFIHSIPELQNQLEGLFLMIREDLDLDNSDIEDIISDLQDTRRLDIKYDDDYDENDDSSEDGDLDWTYTRTIRTPYSEVYALYLNDENAGEIHVHIGKTINTTIITTVDITEKEKAVLMGLVHETILETLEDEYDTHSNINFFSGAEEEI